VDVGLINSGKFGTLAMMTETQRWTTRLRETHDFRYDGSEVVCIRCDAKLAHRSAAEACLAS
jgi:hypothetical protein